MSKIEASRKTKILVISRNPWNDDNSFGNTYSNIFANVKNIELGCLYLNSGVPKNALNIDSFQISEGMLLKNLLGKNPTVGKHIKPNGSDALEVKGKSLLLFNRARVFRWQILFWARDLLWKVSRWNSRELDNFLEEFNPDLIFVPIIGSSILNDVYNYVKTKTNKPSIGYASDDFYTLNQFNFSPLFWIDRLAKRRGVARTIRSCDLVYAVSDTQAREYGKIFSRNFPILTKSAFFNEPPLSWNKKNDSISIVYAGNIANGRWKSISYVADAVNRLSSEGFAVSFECYSATPYTKRMIQSFNGVDSFFKGKRPYEDIQAVLKTADIVVHAEGMDKKNRCVVHQSFSTKLVDYFAMAKCILAVGPADVASIVHLTENDAAAVADSREAVYSHLRELITNPSEIDRLGRAAFECGRRHHNAATMSRMLEEDIARVSGVGR